MNKRLLLTPTLVLLLAMQVLVSQESNSQKLENKLVSGGFTVSEQLLSGSLSAEFPYNILLSLPSTLEFPLYRLFIVISQTQALVYYDEVIQFLTEMTASSLPYPVDIVFSANDEAPHISLENSLAGIKTYILHLDSVSYTASIELRFDPSLTDKDAVLQIGTKGRISPADMIQPLYDSFDSTGLDFSVKGRFNSLYRMGFVRISPILSYILSRDIPSASMTVHPDSISKAASSVASFTQSYKPGESGIWDNNYSLIQVFGRRLFISEYALITVIIIVSGISLFLLCSFSFLVGKTTALRKEELQKTWYLLPVIIGSTAVFLHLAQFLTCLIFPSWQYNAAAAIIIKLAIGLVLLSLVSLAQYLFSFPLTSFIYGYLLLIIVFINVFLSTAVDISLFIPFSIEYLIVYATRSVKRKTSILAAAFLMTLPFLPYLIFIDSDTRSTMILSFVRTSFAGNILFAFVAVPFEIMWIRIMVRMKLFGKQKGVSLKQILIELAGTALIVVLTALTVTLIRSKSNSEYYQKAQNSSIQTSTKSYLSLEAGRTFLFNKANTSVQIFSSLPVVRYDIRIESQSLLPIYDANYPYDSLSKEGTALFALDDYPPNPLFLRFSSSADYPVECTVTAYIVHGSVLIAETKTLVFKEEN